MGLQKASDRIYRRLESEVAKEERWSWRLFLRGKDFSREFRLALPLSLCIVVLQHSGFQRATLKAVALGGGEVKRRIIGPCARTILDEKAASF